MHRAKFAFFILCHFTKKNLMPYSSVYQSGYPIGCLLHVFYHQQIFCYHVHFNTGNGFRTTGCISLYLEEGMESTTLQLSLGARLFLVLSGSRGIHQKRP